MYIHLYKNLQNMAGIEKLSFPVENCWSQEPVYKQK